jgi:hypothetical protein
MSESNSAISLIAYIFAIIPGAYFLYRLVKEAYYIIFKRDDEDILH